MVSMGFFKAVDAGSHLSPTDLPSGASTSHGPRLLLQLRCDAPPPPPPPPADSAPPTLPSTLPLPLRLPPLPGRADDADSDVACVTGGRDRPSPEDTPDADQDHRTLIEAAPVGGFYALLPRLTSAPSTRPVASHTYPTHSSARNARRPEGFLQAVQWSTAHISGLRNTYGYEPIRQSSGFLRWAVAGSSRLVPSCDLVGEGWVAVGDATPAFDPLSSQGMITALEMGCYVGTAFARLLEDR
ncbi:hypothetical protein BC827DRAFT_1271643 [Russula dissimulans]|nr:hypothetical protein BC827DRAFT_1271643 [Russula dissimulans]